MATGPIQLLFPSILPQPFHFTSLPLCRAVGRRLLPLLSGRHRLALLLRNLLVCRAAGRGQVGRSLQSQLK